MKKLLTVCIVILIVFAIGAVAIWLLSRHQAVPAGPAPAATSTPTTAPAATNADEETYHNAAYSYSFTYPASLLLEEYQPNAVVVGERSGTGIVPYAEIDVMESGGEGGYHSFEAYVFERGRTFCAADGPYESISCDRIASSEPFVTASGIKGEKVMLHLVHQNFATDTQTESEFGPVYAFDMRGRIAGSDFSALFVRPSLGTGGDGAHADLISSIAESLTFAP